MSDQSAELVVGGFVKVLDLKHPRPESSSEDVYGRVAKVDYDEVVVVLPSSLDFGYAVTRRISMVESCDHNEIPIGQLEELGVPLQLS